MSPQPSNGTLGAAIRAARKTLGWSQATLAAKAAASQSDISSLEHRIVENVQDALIAALSARLASSLAADDFDLDAGQALSDLRKVTPS